MNILILQEVPSDEKWAEDGPPREAKWWYSTFHTVTAMVGAGVLSLPYAMAYLGWYVYMQSSCWIDILDKCSIL